MAKNVENFSIAIDGLAGCGKSTLAKALAKKYGLLYIDSGAIYRLTAFLFGNGEAIDETDMLFLKDVDILQDGDIIYNGKSYLSEIGLPETNQVVSELAQNALVRSHINDWIQKKAGTASVVMDGRDIGSVVLPNADIKIYLFCSVECRMSRWESLQLKRYGTVDSNVKAQFKESMKKRDYEDLHRKESPLVCVKDALAFDMEKTSLEKAFLVICKTIDEMNS